MRKRGATLDCAERGIELGDTRLRLQRGEARQRRRGEYAQDDDHHDQLDQSEARRCRCAPQIMRFCINYQLHLIDKKENDFEYTPNQ